MRFRLAKPSDTKSLAELHWAASATQPDGFMFKLGIYFFIRYYRITLNEKNSVILCAEDLNGNILGFTSGTLSAEEHTKSLKKHRFDLLLAAIPQLIRKPQLIGGLLSRQQSLSSNDKNNIYVVTNGPRCEYWAWKNTTEFPGGSVLLFKRWLKLMADLGIRNLQTEVDTSNDKAVRMHKLLGAKLTKEITTPDGRQRLIFEYIFKTQN